MRPQLFPTGLADRFTLLLAMALTASCNSGRPAATDIDWRYYGGNQGSQHFSTADQITPANVSSLKEAWRFDMSAGALQATPLMIEGTLYAVTPEQSVIALDPVAGAKRWQFDPADRSPMPVRGLTFWKDGAESILFASHGTMITALDPRSGKPIDRFGSKGSLDLRTGLGRDPKSFMVNLTTPGIVFRDLLIVGFREGETHPNPPGAIRAFDVRTGTLRWRFDTLAPTDDPGSQTWPRGSPAERGGGNNWAGMALDEQRGIVYVPTGSAVDDFYGADRKGSNLYANSLIALDAATGKYRWHFQAVHHDIWDRDLPAPPMLVTVQHGGKVVDAVVQGTKQGFLFAFDRITGTPLFPIEERPVPQSDVPGEVSWPTQPFSALPAATTRQTLTADMLTRRTPAAAASARRQFNSFINKGPYTPMAVGKSTLVFPGFDGGMNWGGGAVDPKRGIVYVNSNDVAWTGALEKYDPHAASPGERIYRENCSVCHGADRKGSPPQFPSLENIFARVPDTEIVKTITQGRGRMPSFGHLLGPDIGMLMGYLAASGQSRHGESGAPSPAARPGRTPAYQFSGYRKFQDDEGYPAVAPPWGTLSAIDMNTGKYLWKIPLGDYPELLARGMHGTGSENYGGPILTGSGLLFIGATIYDRKFRAFDATSGKLLWETVLPYAGNATPMTYRAGGKQYVVIATSGQRDPKGPQGSAYVAFALPN